MTSDERSTAKAAPGGDPMSSAAQRPFWSVREEHGARAQLLDATVQLASEVGLSRMTVRSLCDRAGLATRTFYRYFGDTRAAFLAASVGLHADLRDAIGVAYARGDSPAQRAFACIDALVDFVRADSARADVLFVEGPTGGIAVDAIRAETVEWAVGLVMGSAARRVRAGLHPWDRPADDSTHRLLAEIAVGGVNSVVWRQLIRDDLKSLDDAVPHLVEALLRPYEWARQQM